MNEKTCRPDYKNEYDRLTDRLTKENQKLMEENKYLRIELEEANTERKLLEAKMSVVYLIFGGNRNG